MKAEYKGKTQKVEIAIINSVVRRITVINWKKHDILIWTLAHVLTWSTFSEFLFACCCFSVTQSCPTLCDPLDCHIPCFSVLYYLLELAQTHVHWVGDAIQVFCPLLPTSPALNIPQAQGLSWRVSSSQQVAKISAFQLQHQSFQWIFKVDFL